MVMYVAMSVVVYMVMHVVMYMVMYVVLVFGRVQGGMIEGDDEIAFE